MKAKYFPVDPDFHKFIEQSVKKSQPVAVHYFEKEGVVKNARGMLKGRVTNSRHEEFIVFESSQKIRLDRIIVFNGRPGPAYDEYDSFALACLDCMGGMD